MKISLIGNKESPMNIFDELAKSLSKKITGLELEKRFVPFAEDLPEMARECAEESDFIFVFGFAENEGEAEMIKEKLVDVEIATKTRILKIVTTDEYGDLGEEEYLDQKEALVKQYSDLIVGILFNEERFEPENKDFSI
ncbi:MAG: hypothetical protein NTZ73_00535 [Candidatus Diapherotrites archaeon]|nr:hypothetical protein [Candidatus Diapherotrites archaeon]